jgi:hypothetical protein
MDLVEIGLGVVDWIGLVQDRDNWRALENAVRNVRFEVFTAVAMKNGILWDRNTQFVPHRKQIMSPLQNLAR